MNSMTGCDVQMDAAFCHVCMTAEHEKRLLASIKRDAAFIGKGFSYWRDGTTAFKKHVTSTCHREAMCGMRSRDYGLDVGELLCTKHKNEKEVNRAMFRRVLQNLRFLAHQGLAFRGQGPRYRK